MKKLLALLLFLKVAYRGSSVESTSVEDTATTTIPLAQTSNLIAYFETYPKLVNHE